MDRFFRGLIAGITGGIIMNIINLFSFYVLHYSERLFHDWASVLLFGHLPENLVQNVIAIFTQLLWAGFLGIIFAYLIPYVTSRGYLIKGAFWGSITGFLQYALAILLRMPYFDKVATGTVVTQTIGGLVWGLVLAYMLCRLDKAPINR